MKGIVDPLAQFLACDDHTRGVVGVAEVDDIHTALGNLRYETVLSVAGHVDHIRPLTVLYRAGTTNHHVRIDVHGIDRVGHANGVVPANQFLNITGVALGTIVHEDLVDIQVDATRQEVVLQNGLAQEVVALLRTIAVESLSGAHLVGSLVHRLNHGRTQRLGDVTNTHGDDVGLGVHHFEGVHLLGNICKQIVAWQFQEMFVN